jgi:hypothetical protein
MKNSAERILKISPAVNRDIQRFWKELVVAYSNFPLLFWARGFEGLIAGVLDKI